MVIIGHRSSKSTYGANEKQSHNQTKKQSSKQTKRLLQVSGEGLVLKPIQVGDDDEDDGEDGDDHDIITS